LLPALLAAVGLAAAGLLPLPALLRRKKARLEDGVADLRRSLTAALKAGFERELQASQRRVKDAVAPFAAFVRTEGAQLRALSDGVARRSRDLSSLRTRIEALR
jgi:hypothetical protein